MQAFSTRPIFDDFALAMLSRQHTIKIFRKFINPEE
jgi:hypothetical protein